MAPRYRTCTHGPCTNLATVAGRCDQHKRHDARPSSTARGYGQRWRATRADHLIIEPWCRICLGRGRQVEATEVDHIDGLGPLGPRGHDHDNLRSLCKPHHSRRTARDQPGGAVRRSQ